MIITSTVTSQLLLYHHKTFLTLRFTPLLFSYLKHQIGRFFFVVYVLSLDLEVHLQYQKCYLWYFVSRVHVIKTCWELEQMNWSGPNIIDVNAPKEAILSFTSKLLGQIWDSSGKGNKLIKLWILSTGKQVTNNSSIISSQHFHQWDAHSWLVLRTCFHCRSTFRTCRSCIVCSNHINWSTECRHVDVTELHPTIFVWQMTLFWCVNVVSLKILSDLNDSMIVLSSLPPIDNLYHFIHHLCAFPDKRRAVL